jgi:hypothetical protein
VIRAQTIAPSSLAPSLGLLLLVACSPKPQTPPSQPVALDCAQPFDALKAKIVGQPGLVAAPKDPNEPYRFYSMGDGRTSYLITEPGAPGHPAILMQTARGKEVATSGCPYGDRKGFEEVRAYLDGLKTWTRK